MVGVVQGDWVEDVQRVCPSLPQPLPLDGLREALVDELLIEIPAIQERVFDALIFEGVEDVGDVAAVGAARVQAYYRLAAGSVRLPLLEVCS